jgi:hypothetical protein
MIGKKINQLATELAPASTDLTIIGNPTTGVSKKITLEQLGAIFSGAVSFYTNLAAFPNPGTINVIYCAKDTKKLYLWSGTAYVEVFPSQALLDTYQLRSEKGVSNGYASLDSGGKVPISQLPSSIMEYKGTWNAATNTPTLANGTGDTGDVFLCNVAGTVNFGAGPITFAVGDYVIYSGTIWQRSSGAVGTVTSVAATITGDAIGITGSPVTTSGTLALAFAGNSTQYVNGAGNLVTFPGVINEAQNLITEVYNKTGATLTKGTVVYINGGQGNLPTVTKALATGDSTSAQTYGIVRNDITNNNNGYVVVAGRISDLDTQAFTEGTQLYLSPTTAGTYTSTKPYAPNHLVYVGIVVRAHPTQGVVEVKIQNGYEMDELHNVAAQSPDNNDILQYKTATSLWTKVAGTTSNIAEGSNLYYTDARSRAALSFTAGSGAYNSTTGVITIPTNTNQLTNGANYITLASLSAGAGISYNNTTGVIASTITQYTDALARAAISLTTTGTSGAATYNNTTGVLNIPQYTDQFVGTVTSVAALTIGTTGTDLSSTVANSTTTPVITLNVPTASATNRGALSSADWTTFNNKQPQLNGTGFVKASGTTISYDNSTYLTTSSASSLYLPLAGGTLTGALGGTSASFTANMNADDYNMAGWKILDWTGSVAQIGGIASSQWNQLEFFTSGTSKLILNTSGNLGLGVTPSAWSVYRAFQLGTGIAVGGLIGRTDGVNEINFGLNWTYTGGASLTYIASSFATNYYQKEGAHIWQIAPSGTAGNAISFTQAMTLNASGNLSLGNTDNTYLFDMQKNGGNASVVQRIKNIGTNTNDDALIYFSTQGSRDFSIGLDRSSGLFNFTGGAADVSSNIRLSIDAITGAATFSSSVTATELYLSTSNGLVGNINSSNANGGYLTWQTSGAVIADIGTTQQIFGSGGNDTFGINGRGARAIAFGTNNTERMRITSVGNVGIGTPSPNFIQQIHKSDGAASVTQYTNADTGSASSNGLLCGIDSGEDGLFFHQGAKALRFGTSDTERMRITSGGNVEINTGSIKTGEPDTGYGRAAIKIGARNTGQAFNSGGHLPVNIDGTIYFINVYSSLP